MGRAERANKNSRRNRLTFNLWLDDVREPPEGWAWALTVSDAQTYLNTGRVGKASLDHDLGACEDCLGSLTDEQWLERSDFKAMPHCEHYGTGYALCVWMAEHGIWPAEKPTVHSMNPVGRDRMRGVIDRYFPGKRSESPRAESAVDPSADIRE